MSRKNDGINETILGWFKRVHPEELWAIKEMPPTVTFKDMEKSMAAGQGMGEASRHSDTATRELMLDRLAELLDKSVGDLVDWCNAKFMARIRSEYKAKQSPNRHKPDCGRIRSLAVSAQVEIKKLAAAMENVDCLILADTLGRDGLVELKGRLEWIESQIDKVKSTIGEAWEFV